MSKKQTIVFFTSIYVVVAFAWAFLVLLHYVDDNISRKNQSLQTIDVSFTDFEKQDIEILNENGTVALTTTEDPQLIIENLAQIGKVRDVSFSIEFSKNPGEVTLYYAKENAPFSNDKKVWGKQQNDGSYSFTLPRENIGKIRIDPTNQNGVTMTIKSFTINPQKSFFNYFRVTNEQWFKFIIYPALFAAFVAYFITEFNLIAKIKKLKQEGAKLYAAKRCNKQ